MTRLNRRHLLALAAGAAAAPWASWAAPGPKVQVWKSPTCGCCKDWIVIMEKAGFDFEVFDTGNTAVRARLGLDLKYASCHTALVDGYAIEGHVPPADVKRLLAERPKAVGLAVPGMPVGSPGMDGPAYGGRKDPYDVLLVQFDGSARIWTPYR